jgi:hypothetical protein
MLHDRVRPTSTRICGEVTICGWTVVDELELRALGWSIKHSDSRHQAEPKFICEVHSLRIQLLATTHGKYCRQLV